MGWDGMDRWRAGDDVGASRPRRACTGYTVQQRPATVMTVRNVCSRTRARPVQRSFCGQNVRIQEPRATQRTRIDGGRMDWTPHMAFAAPCSRPPRYYLCYSVTTKHRTDGSRRPMVHITQHPPRKDVAGHEQQHSNSGGTVGCLFLRSSFCGAAGRSFVASACVYENYSSPISEPHRQSLNFLSPCSPCWTITAQQKDGDTG